MKQSCIDINGYCYEGLTPVAPARILSVLTPDEHSLASSLRGSGLHRFDPLFYFWRFIRTPFVVAVDDLKFIG